MNHIQLYTAGSSTALFYAADVLRRQGYELCATAKDATHLLLPIPSFAPDGTIPGIGSPEEFFTNLPANITIFGGNLDRPELAAYSTFDLLKDPEYLAKNAMITAHCAIQIAASKLPITLEDCSVLVIGWGRIGKCLAKLLRQLDADVTVAARKESDRAMLRALGYHAIAADNPDTLPYRLIFNTVPVMIAPHCPGPGLKIDLASKPGLGGTDVIWARGLPGKNTPESSGTLIAQTVINKLQRKELHL